MLHHTDCELCGLYADCKTYCIRGKGSKSANILLVGEAPGYHEDAEGVPFVGKSGELLDGMLDLVKLKGQVYITNAVKCRPKDNAKPSQKQIAYCHKFLAREIAKLKPKVIVTLGDVPLRAVLNRVGVSRLRGTVQTVIVGSESYKVIPTFHPAFALRMPSKAECIISDLYKAKSILTDNDTFESPEIIPVSDDIVDSVLQEISAWKKHFVSAVDVEGTGKNPFQKNYKLVSYAFTGRGNKVYFVPADHPENTSYISKKNYTAILKKLFLNDNIYLCFHNGYYDVNAVRVTTGIRAVNYAHDTILAHHLVDENAAHDLDTLGKYYLPFAPEHKAVMKQRMKEEKGDMSRVDLDTLCEYNSRDAFNTLKLLEIFLPKIDSENMSWAYEVVMMRGINVLSDIGFNGIAIDPEAVKKADKIYEELIADITRKINGRPQVKQAIKIWAEKKMAKAAKPKSVQHYYESFNPASSVQISILLYDVLKMPVLEVSKNTKNPSTGKRVLATFARKNKLCASLLEHRKLQKAYSGYVKPAIPKWMDTFDGRSHSSYTLHVARTGRPSSKNPNHANIPRKKTNADIKNFFVAKPGYKFVQADFSQMELRVLACYSKEPKLIAAYNSGADIHREFASYFYKVPIENVTDEMRQIAKGAHFGVLYGMGAPALAERAGCSVREAERIINALFTRYPYVKRWISQTVAYARTHCEVVSLIGRKRRLPDIKSPDEGIRNESERQAVNTPIQGLATDMMLLQLYRINKFIQKANIPAKPLVTVYDSILFEVREDIVPIFAKTMKRMIEDFSPYPFDWLCVPIVADFEIGTRWGALDKYEIM